jgi:hypothetical protein
MGPKNTGMTAYNCKPIPAKLQLVFAQILDGKTGSALWKIHHVVEPQNEVMTAIIGKPNLRAAIKRDSCIFAFAAPQFEVSQGLPGRFHFRVLSGRQALTFKLH